MKVANDVFEPAKVSPLANPVTDPPAKFSRQGDYQISPSQLGDYRIIREIGRGGMGVVYEAHQQTLDRVVALKVLPQRFFANQNSVERFRREARAASQLHHTNIVPVFDSGEEHGTVYYTMQLIDGDSLDRVRQQVSRSKPSHRDVSTVEWNMVSTERRTTSEDSPEAGEGDSNDADASSIQQSHELEQNGSPYTRAQERFDNYFEFVVNTVQQAAAALQHAHDRGVIHRDVKPSNLILDNEGIVWLADFGLARTEDDGLTGSLEAPGTLRYMSPERFKGQYSESSDVYSLGALLYEMLTLKPAYDAPDSLALLDKIQNSEPASPRDVDPAIPHDLQTIALKALAKEPERRYPSARAMRDDLGCFANGQPISARHVGLAERFWLWSKRNRGLASSMAAICMLVLLLAAGSAIAAIYFNHQSSVNAQLASANKIETAKAKSQRDTATLNAYFSDMKQSHQDWQNGETRRMLTTLAKYMSPLFDRDVRGWEWYYLLALAFQEKFTILDHQDALLKTCWSPSGHRIYSADKGGRLVIRQADGRPIHQIPAPGLASFALSKDGAYLATISVDENIRLWDAQTGELKRTFKIFAGNCPDMEWIDDQRLFMALRDYVPAQVNVAAGQKQHLDVHHSRIERGNSIAIDPTGKFCLYQTAKGTDLLDLESNRIQHRLAREHITLSASWAPDGKQFAVGTRDHGGWLYVQEAGAAPSLLRRFGNEDSIESLCFSPDGKWLIAGNRNTTIRLYSVKPFALKREFKGHLAPVVDCKFHPDSGSFLTAGMDGSLKIWETMPARVTADTVTKKPSLERSRKPASQPYHWTRDDKGTTTVSSRKTGEPKLTFRSQLGNPEHYPHLKWLAVWKPDRQGVMVWDTTTWKLLRDKSLRKASYFREGKLIGRTDLNMVKIVNFNTGDHFEFLAHRGQRRGILAVSADGSKITTGVDGCVSVWDSSSGRKRFDCFGHHPALAMTAAAWSQCGKVFATASADQTVRVWDGVTGESLFVLRGHGAAPNQLKFSSDGSRLFSRATNLKVWEMASGREVISFDSASEFPAIDELLKSPAQLVTRLSRDALDFAGLTIAQSLESDATGLGDYQHQALSYRALTLLAHLGSEEFDSERGLRDATNAHRLDPTNCETHAILALAHFRKSQFEQALRTLRLSTDSRQDKLGLYEFVMSMALARTGKVAEAKSWLSAGVKKFAVFGQTRVDIRQYEEAQALLNEAASLLFEPEPSKDDHAAQDIEVTTLDDTVFNGPTDGLSLREAITVARAGDRILLKAEGTIPLMLGDITIGKSLRIEGSGPDKHTIKASFSSPVFKLRHPTDRSDSRVDISGVRFHLGVGDYKRDIEGRTRGGAIFTEVAATFQDCHFEGCTSHQGGAVYIEAGSEARFNQCEFFGNFSHSGGAIFVARDFERFGRATIESCSFYDNQSSHEGAAIFSMGSIGLSNSTFTKNKGNVAKAELEGTCIAIAGDASSTSITHCTVVRNEGGGIGTFEGLHLQATNPHWRLGCETQIENSIVTENTNCSADVNVSPSQLAKPIAGSLIGMFPVSIEKTAGNLYGVDAKLGTFANHQGPTKTISLQLSSPAIDAGTDLENMAPFKFDQRGKPFIRNHDGNDDGIAKADAGAYELQ